jgi:hypothetical protein
MLWKMNSLNIVELYLNLIQSIMPVINHHLIAERSHEVDDDAVGPAEARLHVVFPAAPRSARR